MYIYILCCSMLLYIDNNSIYCPVLNCIHIRELAGKNYWTKTFENIIYIIIYIYIVVCQTKTKTLRFLNIDYSQVPSLHRCFILNLTINQLGITIWTYEKNKHFDHTNTWTLPVGPSPAGFARKRFYAILLRHGTMFIKITPATRCCFDNV